MLKRIFRQCSQMTLILFANCKDSDPTLAWTKDDVFSELKKANLPKAANVFKEHGISGHYFDQDTAELLDYVVGEGIIELKELKTLMYNLKRDPKCNGDKRDRKTSRKLKPDKVILDAVHGNIVLPSLCVNIIDTPQFQRLRHLKQMGVTSFVYPGGTHTRFEHSLGACSLSGLLVKQLREVHKDDADIEIDDKDILCVQIAGLCHDLGHGPFSHMFDNNFLPSVRKEQNKEPIKHEELSVKMLEHMLRDPANKLVTKFRDNDLKKKDLIFIKEQIYHPEDGQQKRETPCKEWTKKGRKQSKSFLYQIVSNEHNGVDVDKWDYLARDSLHLGMRNSFDHHRLIRFARIVKANNEYQICLRDKEIYNVYEMYHVRLSLQKWVWYHRVGAAINLMLVEALTKVKNILKYPGKNGKDVPLAECVDDMEAFTHLTDNIFSDILLMKDTSLSDEDKRNLKDAQEILKSIERRDVYEFLYESPPLRCDLFKDKKTAEHEEDAKKEFFKEGFTEQDRQDMNGICRVQLSKMDYGKNLRNPIRDLHVYSKDCQNIARRLEAHEVSRFVPQDEYCEMRFRVFILPQNYEKFKDLWEKMKSNADNYFKDKERLKGKKCLHNCCHACSANECQCKQ